jgi:hypothetical protein
MRNKKAFNVGAAVIAPESCPYCSTKNPSLCCQWKSENPISGALTPSSVQGKFWAVYSCNSCGNCVLAFGEPVPAGNQNPHLHRKIVDLLPRPRTAADELPSSVRRYLQQAFDCLHAPDAAGLLCASAVDAMLKEKGYRDGTLYVRIDKAVEDRLLTKDMGEWAHKVRLESNSVRHAKLSGPHLTQDDAESVIEFTEALGDFLFVFTDRVRRGIEK